MLTPLTYISFFFKIAQQIRTWRQGHLPYVTNLTLTTPAWPTIKLTVHSWLRQCLFLYAFTPDFSFQHDTNKNESTRWDSCRWWALITCEHTNDVRWKRTQKFAVTGSCKVGKWTSYNVNALKHSLFQIICQHFFRSCFEWLISLDFSRFLSVSFVRPWIITLLKSIKSIHIPQYFMIIAFDRCLN